MGLYAPQTKRGKIDKEDLKEACRHFNMIISEPVLDDLMDHCDVDKDGLIDFLEFSNFLNWKDKMAINSTEQKILTGGKLKSVCFQTCFVISALLDF